MSNRNVQFRSSRYLTNSGIEYLREYLHLPPEIVPTTLKFTRNVTQSSRPMGGDDRPPRMGGRGGGYGGRDDYRKAQPAPGEFNPTFVCFPPLRFIAMAFYERLKNNCQTIANSHNQLILSLDRVVVVVLDAVRLLSKDGARRRCRWCCDSVNLQSEPRRYIMDIRIRNKMGCMSEALMFDLHALLHCYVREPCCCAACDMAREWHRYLDC